MELLISVGIITILSVGGFSIFRNAAARGRDARRIADIEQIRVALEMYRRVNGEYPRDCGLNDGHWGNEISTRPNGFMNYLKPYMGGKVPVDPLNRSPQPPPYGVEHTANDYFYQYNYYDSGEQGAYAGCEWDGPYGVLAIRSFEGGPPANYTPDQSCSRPNPPNPITFQEEYDYYIFLTDGKSATAQPFKVGLSSSAPPCNGL